MAIKHIATALSLSVALSGLALAESSDPNGKSPPMAPAAGSPMAPDAGSPMAPAPGSMTPDAAISDGDYANKMAMGDMYEITSSNLVAERSDSADVEALAKTIIADHTASTAELLEILGKTGASMSNKLDDKHQALVDALTPLKGAAFDKAYLDQQVAAHQEGLALNQQYASTGGNAEMKRLADKVIPKIQMHLDMAMKLGGMAPTP